MNILKVTIAFIIILQALIACAYDGESVEAQDSGSIRKAIGVAKMNTDGVIIMQLTIIDENNPSLIGDAYYEVLPSDKERYKNILDHLGGLSLGESKFVPPWPDK